MVNITTRKTEKLVSTITKIFNNKNVLNQNGVFLFTKAK